MSKADGVESKVREIRHKTRRKYTAEEKIRIVLEGLRGEESIAALCRREGIAPNLYYSWSKEFLEAGKRRLMIYCSWVMVLLLMVKMSFPNTHLNRKARAPSPARAFTCQRKS
jgi:hypothetical protein